MIGQDTLLKTPGNRSENKNTEANSVVRMDVSKEPKSKSSISAADSKGKSTELSHVKCYNCGERGHIATTCPANPTKANMFCRGEQQQLSVSKASSVCRSGQIGDITVDNIVLDTGCSRTMVREDLVHEGQYLKGDAITIRCAHGDTVLYPVAKLEMEVDGLLLSVEAAVSKTLPVPVLLGTDVPELDKLLGIADVRPYTSEQSLMVVTRAQSLRQTQEDVAMEESEQQCGVKPSVPLVGSEFDEELFLLTRDKPKKTRSQKRADCQHHQTLAQQAPTPPLSVSTDELRRLQREDTTLAGARKFATNPDSLSVGDFYWNDGLLYHQWKPSKKAPELVIEQLVLPVQCCSKVLELAHNIPLAGHLGKDKTRQRVAQQFFWPTLCKDVEEFCRCCPQCQKSGHKKVPKAPLVPLPIVATPFQKIAMDIVGPLPRSRSGNRYVLVICDYATRYPEAILVRSIDAENIAEELIKLFARVGIPQSILTDQGSNFTSKLLMELYRLLRVQGIRTSPYHPQTDGLVERFNQTLKLMLRKVIDKEGKDWDKLLPYVLFAYREVPQASTGFSPFELLYGRSVRGPLSVLKESWQAAESQDVSVVSYILDIREKLQQMSKLVEQNLTKAQMDQKYWYDKNARHREFQPGDQVLVLLPTSTSKLLAQWQGPYEVVKRIGEVDYLIDMHDRRRKRRVFHVNMLKLFHCLTENTEISLWVEEQSGESDNDMLEDTVPAWTEQQSGQPTIGSQLRSNQQSQLQQLLEEFTDVLQSKPGRTSLVEHFIDTGNASPIRRPPYRVPHAYRDSVKAELDQMLESGIIEPSSSQWAAPLVLVKKKDSTLRLCVDYRRLNSVSRVDAYPMPRIDDLLDRLGKAKFISTMDLTRGYWQVPVAESDRDKTAFHSPFGFFQFRMMPFGLQGAPATFQRMMDCLLHGLQSFSAAYLDDLVIFSETWEEHLEHLRSILSRLRESGLTAKPSKCQYAMEHCIYLGHVVGGGIVKPETDKLRAVRELPVPTDKTQVRMFLGITGYYRKFLPNYASVATPLTDLTKKSAPNRVVWTEQCQQAWQRLKDLLCSAPVLKSPDFSQPFILQTDASERGVGAVLSQVDNMGKDHPVAYYSKKLLPREVRYSTVEKECLAIRLATDFFRVYLLGRLFTIQTDHRALQWLDRLKDTNPRLAKWSLALQPYQFVVEHRAGILNGNADALSRVAAN